MNYPALPPDLSDHVWRSLRELLNAAKTLDWPHWAIDQVVELARAVAVHVAIAKWDTRPRAPKIVHVSFRDTGTRFKLQSADVPSLQPVVAAAHLEATTRVRTASGVTVALA